MATEARDNRSHVRRTAPTVRQVSFVGVELPESSPRLEAGPRIVTDLLARSCVISFAATDNNGPAVLSAPLASALIKGRSAITSIPRGRLRTDAAGEFRLSPRKGFHVPHFSALALSVDWHSALASRRVRPRRAYWAVHSTGSGTAESLHSQTTIFHQDSIVLSDSRFLFSAWHNCIVSADVRGIRVARKSRPFTTRAT